MSQKHFTLRGIPLAPDEHSAGQNRKAAISVNLNLRQ
jgi:hypothetical protein